MESRKLSQDLQSLDVDISEEEIRELAAFHFYLKTQSQSRLADTPIAWNPDDIEGGETTGSIIGGLIGVGLSFVLPGIGLAAGLAIGSAIGGLAGAALAKPKGVEPDDQSGNRRNSKSYGISATKGLVELGQPVPIIFCNRNRNKNGGVRFSGQLICSWVDTFKGVQKLHEQYVACLGKVGGIDTSQTLLDGQGLDNFLYNEVLISQKLGSQTQDHMANFPYYSQVVSPSLNTQLGLDLRSVVAAVKVRRKETIADELVKQSMIVTRTENNCRVKKSGGAIAGFVSKDRIRQNKDGFVQAQILKGSWLQYIGITNQSTITQTPFSMPFAFQFNNAQYTCKVAGVDRTTATAYIKGDIFTIEYINGVVVFRRNRAIVYTATDARVYPARLAAYILDFNGNDADGVEINDLRVGNNISYSKGGTKPGIGTTLVLQAPEFDEDEDLSEEELLESARNETDQFSPAETYTSAGQNFRIIAKNWNLATVTADTQLNLGEGDEIYVRWVPNFETTKKVNELHINLVCQLFARDEKNRLIKHGVLFDCYIRSSTIGWTFAFRGLISNSSEGEIRRYFKLKNLPYGKYQVELRPLRRANDQAVIWRFNDTGARDTRNTSAVIGGKTVRFETQIDGQATVDEANKIIYYDQTEKPAVSTQQGAPIAITSVNEVVTRATPPTYPGFALIGIEYLASERIQAAPTPNFLMAMGTEARAHIAAGTVQAVLSTTIYTTEFLISNPDPVRAGDVLRNLDKKLEASVTAVAEGAIATSVNLQWETGDRYLVYRTESINYFSDAYAFVLGDPDAGLGARIDRDEWLDYPSIVRSRRFCVANQFYWDGVIASLVGWRQWAAQEAIGSRLLPCRIDGRFGIIPEEETPITFLFNASNVFNYKEEWLDWSMARCNSLIVSYTDGNDDFKTKTVRIQSPEAFNSLEALEEKSLQLPAVTNRGQAIQAGAIVFKSPRIQTRSISFTTGQMGCYLKPGDLIQGQHISTQWQFERSGMVTALLAFAGGTQTIQISQPIGANAVNLRAAVQYKDTGETKSDLLAAMATNEQVAIAGLSRPLALGDTVIIGTELEERRTYRVSAVKPTEEGAIDVVGIYWNKSILTLDGLVIDGECSSSEPTYNFDKNELLTWLTGADSYLTTYTRNTTPMIANSDYLLVNSFHDVLGRGGYFPAQSGTSEGQFIMSKASAAAYEATGNASWLNRAVNFGQAAINFLYRGQAVPASPNTPFAPHWLFIVKGTSKSKGLTNPDPLAYGHFDVSVSFSGGVGNIPIANNGNLLADVYNARLPGSRLLWRNVYSPVIPNSSELSINYWVAQIGGVGGNFRIYPTTAQSSGTAPTPTSEAVGKVVLNNTGYSGSAILTYSSYSGVDLAKNAMFEAYPMWRALLNGEVNCATDTLPWAYETYDRLFALTNNQQWAQARDASGYTARLAASIENLSHYWRRSNASDPLYYPGSQIVQVNNTAGYTLSRVSTGDKTGWVRLDVNNGSELFPSIEFQNFAVQTLFDDQQVDLLIEVAASVANQVIEVYVSTSPDAFNTNQIYRAFFLAPSTPQQALTKVLLGRDLIKWNVTKSELGHFLWHPAIVDSPLYTYSGGGGTAVVTRIDASIGQYSPMVWRINLSKGAGFAGAGFVISEGATTVNPPSIYFRASGIVTYRVQDNANNWYSITLPQTDGNWQRFSPAWSDMSGSPAPVTNANIKNVDFEAVGTSQIDVFFLATNDTYEPARLPLPSTAYKAALVSRNDTAHSIWVGTFRPRNNPLDEIPYDGAFVFTYNQINGQPLAWKGLFYMGYQSPWIWIILADRARSNNVMQMLRDAMDDYALTHSDGGMTPTFAPPVWDSGDYLSANRPINTFGWQGPDPNTGWGGYYVRPLLETAKALVLEPNNPYAQQILTRAFTFLKSFYLTNGRFPTNFQAVGEATATYHEPHVAAIIMESAVWANIAGLDPDISFPLIRYGYEYLRSQYVSSGTMAGSFTAGQPVSGAHRENFGFWVANEVEAIATLLKNLDKLRYPC
jgi:Putative phage tail protein